MTAIKPVALIILDGFGHSETSQSNAIKAAHTPMWDKLWNESPRGLISSSGMDVGLPPGQMGNSEVGHMNLGAGRVVYQDFTRITKAIEEKTFFDNSAFTDAIDKAINTGKAVHLLGLLSPGGVHSHEGHFQAMIQLAADRGAKQIYVHAFLDGRDMPPRSAEPSIEKIDQQLHDLGVGRIASVVGRYYAMDRDNRWDRIQSAYEMLTEGKTEFLTSSAKQALTDAYDRNENDEFVAATSIVADNETVVTINDGDAVIFMNFRADRARQITRAFVDNDFDGFSRNKRPQLADFVMLTQYAANIHTTAAYPPVPLSNVLGEYLASQNKTQLRIAETEKYAHVTFFFSGGREDPFEGEERILVQSPDVATYDLQPEMNAPEVTDHLVNVILEKKYDAIICNFANGDMVGHTGNFDAAVKAVECLDVCLSRITEALLTVGGECLITADHGNVEQMNNEETGQAHTAHTCEPVPFVYVGDRAIDLQASGGTLSDVAPTILTLMGLEQPIEMTGCSLITLKKT